MRIVVLTGAGVSAESGVPTFRDADGLWENYDPMKLATPEGFQADPATVHEFYNLRRARLGDIEPNPAHRALGRLQEALAGVGGELTLVTQNLDDLHERGGAVRVLHMHGEILKARCENCGDVADWRVDITLETPCPACSTPSYMRPHVVWFGEIPMHLDEVAAAVESADLFVSIGTSGEVYPAAGFVAHARACGVATMEINLEPSANAEAFDEARYGKAGEIVPAWVEDVIAALRVSSE